MKGGAVMNKDKVILALAEYFDIEPDDETGDYDLDSYDWSSGCSFGGGIWLSLANVVQALENAGLFD